MKEVHQKMLVVVFGAAGGFAVAQQDFAPPQPASLRGIHIQPAMPLAQAPGANGGTCNCPQTGPVAAPAFPAAPAVTYPTSPAPASGYTAPASAADTGATWWSLPNYVAGVGYAGIQPAGNYQNYSNLPTYSHVPVFNSAPQQAYVAPSGYAGGPSYGQGYGGDPGYGYGGGFNPAPAYPAPTSYAAPSPYAGANYGYQGYGAPASGPGYGGWDNPYGLSNQPWYGGNGGSAWPVMPSYGVGQRYGEWAGWGGMPGYGSRGGGGWGTPNYGTWGNTGWGSGAGYGNPGGNGWANAPSYGGWGSAPGYGGWAGDQWPGGYGGAPGYGGWW